MTLIERLRNKKLNNKGVSLVEVICAVGILSLVGTAVVGMMLVSTRSYQRGVLEIEVQQEAQFAANLIGDLLKDAKEVIPAENPGDALIIKKDGSAGLEVYEITHNDSDNTIWIKLGTNDPQLLAERVDSLPAVTPVGGNTYTVDMNLTRSDAVNTFEVTNSNNARNQVADETVLSTDVTATILAPSEMVLEPNLKKTIEFAVTGIPNKTVNWSITSAHASHTKIVGNEIQIAGDETNEVLTILGETETERANGSPAGSTVILVYIRRVTGFSMSSELLSGIDGNAGAKYKVSVTLTGLNMDKKPTIETDYISPYKLHWDGHYYINGGEVSDTWSYYTLSINEGDAPDQNYAIVQLNSNMNGGSKFILSAMALHPEGTYNDGLNTYITNKSGLKYTPSFSGKFTLEGHIYDLYPGNFYRASEQAQGSVDEWTVKRLVAESNGISDPNQLTVFKEVRYKVRGTNNWTSWIPMSEGGNAIRIQEDSWMFACDKDYDIEIRFGARTWDGRKYYPTNLGESGYTIRTGLEHTKLRFDVSSNRFNQTAIYGVGPESNPIRMSAGTNLSFNVNSQEANKQAETGIRWERFNKSLIIKIQKRSGSGWADVPIKYRNDGGNVEVRSSCDSGRNLAEMTRTGNYFTFYNKGTYRILIGIGSEMGGDQVKLLVYNESGRYFETRSNNNYYLWNEATGEGIFYVKVE
ncbi:MAG: hypothetical protein IK018_08965 [Lachnospiraceae bacterium]|nr:hypothetical protein [Lachnospiraceae bacterium]